MTRGSLAATQYLLPGLPEFRGHASLGYRLRGPVLPVLGLGLGLLPRLLIVHDVPPRALPVAVQFALAEEVVML